MNLRRATSRTVIGAATAVLALLALAAMHGLPTMGMAMPAADVGVMSAVDAASAPTMTHALSDPMAAMGHDAAAHLGTALGATAASAVGVAVTGHDAGGVPLHGHSFVHLCLAVLVAGLTFAVGRWLRPRASMLAPLTRQVAQRPLFSLDVGAPNRVALCVVRC